MPDIGPRSAEEEWKRKKKEDDIRKHVFEYYQRLDSSKTIS